MHLGPLAEGRSRSDIKGEIGRVVSGELAGRSNDDEITVYKSLGVTAQDLFAAQLVWSKAAAAGRGPEVEFGD
jgi:ornithine cyclodeaminase/alanine dehydrogenase-like protein (mu-crystallin family)